MKAATVLFSAVIAAALSISAGAWASSVSLVQKGNTTGMIQQIVQEPGMYIVRTGTGKASMRGMMQRMNFNPETKVNPAPGVPPRMIPGGEGKVVNPFLHATGPLDPAASNVKWTTIRKVSNAPDARGKTQPNIKQWPSPGDVLINVWYKTVNGVEYKIVDTWTFTYFERLGTYKWLLTNRRIHLE